MKNSKLACPLFIIVLIFSILMIVGSASAQSISKPSSPDFTAKIVANTIEVTIKNQPLTPYENGSYPSLYYMFRFKDHNTKEGFWDYDPEYFVLPSTYGGYHKASDSELTVISLSLEGHHFPSEQIDIQAIALFGNQYPTNMQNGTIFGFEGEISGWSNIQTITIASSTELTSIPKPSVPEFTIELVKDTIEVKIKNQPFVSYYDAIINWTIDFYYNIRIKGNFSEDWTELYLVEELPTSSYSEYTVLSYSPVGENSYILGNRMIEFPAGSQVDFQVEAMIGYVHRVFNPNWTSPLEMYPYIFTGETSGWSATRTMPEQKPHQIEAIEIILAIVLIITVIGACLLGYLKKRHAKINSLKKISQFYLGLVIGAFRRKQISHKIDN